MAYLCVRRHFTQHGYGCELTAEKLRACVCSTDFDVCIHRLNDVYVCTEGHSYKHMVRNRNLLRTQRICSKNSRGGTHLV